MRVVTARGMGLLAFLALFLACAAPRASAAAPPPSAKTCAAFAAHRTRPPIQSYDAHGGGVRVFAMQFKQEARNVVSYGSFRTKIECLIRRDVVPHLAHDRPNVVAFNEDIGLFTVGTGSRGAQARAVLDGSARPNCSGQGAPCAAAAALGGLYAGYGKEIAYYRSKFPDMKPVSAPFVAATDTFVRGFMTTFSDMARRYHVYILGSSDQPRFRVSTDAADIAALADPDLPKPSAVYVATGPKVYNEAFMWAPRDGTTVGPTALRNLVARNRKVPLTPVENTFQFEPGPATGPEAVDNVRPYHFPGTKIRMGFATSLPAFVYGTPPAGVDPCSDTSKYYMRCLAKLGTNLVMQDEANPGRWTGSDGDGVEKWQPLSWMTSTWRASSDPTVHFAYNVTPMLVGNLGDLPFDGQSAITQRGLRGRGCHYIGNAKFLPGDDRPDLRDEAGPKSQFLAMAPWVRRDGPRDDLRAVGAKLDYGSGDPLENDYLETAIVADLPYPPNPNRRGCATKPLGKQRLVVRARPARARLGELTRFTFSVRVPFEGRLRAVPHTRILFAGRRLRADRSGRLVLRARPQRTGRRRVVATAAGVLPGRTVVRVHR
jgi:hypothetical protein